MWDINIKISNLQTKKNILGVGFRIVSVGSWIQKTRYDWECCISLQSSKGLREIVGCKFIKEKR